jgi:hypothetical protein
MARGAGGIFFFFKFKFFAAKKNQLLGFFFFHTDTSRVIEAHVGFYLAS